MRWLVLLAVVLLLGPEMPDGVFQFQQLDSQERQFEALYSAFTSLWETVTEEMRRMDELEVVLRRNG